MPKKNKNEIEKEIERGAGVVYRQAVIEYRADDDDDNRTIDLSFSSEEPYRRWWGVEILDHDTKSIDLEFLESKTAPLLMDHDIRDQIGVIESVEIGSDRKGRSTVRFGKSERASEILVDVKDKIRQNVSVGYRVNRMVLEEANEDDDNIYRVTDWTPLEISIVSIPADPTVGIGRSADETKHFNRLIEKATKMPKENKPQETNTTTVENENNGQNQPQVRAQATPGTAAPGLTRSESEIRSEVADIMSLAQLHSDQDNAIKHIAKGGNLETYRGDLLLRLGETKPLETVPGDLGLNEKEQRTYSLFRALHAQATGDWRGAEYERELSDEIAKRADKSAQGFFMPYDILAERHLVNPDGTRALNVGTASAGGNLVGTDHLGGSFIDALRNRLVLKQLGAQVLTGLRGNLSIPGLNAKTGYAWVAEDGAPAEGVPTFKQIPMSPKSIAGFVNMTRKLLLQSDPSVEGLIRNDLVSNIAVGIDTAGINGGGSNEPTGIMQTVGIGAVVGGTNGLAPTWGHMIDLATAVAVANADEGALNYLTNSKVVGTLAQTPKIASTDSRMIMEKRNELWGYNVARTESVPSDLTKGTGTDLSAMIFGNFNDVIIGEWGTLDVLINPYANDTKGSTRVTAFMDVDVAIRRPASFAAFQDIITS